MSNFRQPGFDSAQGTAGVLSACLCALASALPQSCVLCAAASADALLCEPCTHSLPRIGAACPLCALPSPAAAVCGPCLRRPPPPSATVAPLTYAFPVDRLVQGLKYGGRLALAQPLADALAKAVLARDDARPLPDVLVPLPLARDRQRQRGFNQAAEIARALGRRLDRPLGHLLVRTGATIPQAALQRRARVRNVRGVFAASSPVRGLSVAVVDDVMTTGATLREATRVLLAAGALRVEAWAVARALPSAQAPH